MAKGYYEQDGIKAPRVTRILDQYDKSGPLTHWAANCCADKFLEQLENFDGHLDETTAREFITVARKDFRRVSQKALDVGSRVHEGIERFLIDPEKDLPFFDDEQCEHAFRAFLDWYENWHPETITTEQTLFCPRYAGTCDWICKMDGKVWIIDFKTSKAIYETMRWQLAAYRSLLPVVNASGILRLDKETGMPEFVDVSDTHDKDLEIFNILTDLWWAINGHKVK